MAGSESEGLCSESNLLVTKKLKSCIYFSALEAGNVAPAFGRP